MLHMHAITRARALISSRLCTTSPPSACSLSRTLEQLQTRMQSDEQSLQAARAAAASQQEQFRALARNADAAHEATRAELRAAQARLGSSETALMHARVGQCDYTPTPPLCPLASSLSSLL